MKSPCAILPAMIFYLGILIIKGLTVRRLYKSFGITGLIRSSTNIFTLIVNNTFITRTPTLSTNIQEAWK
jgi:hypothetical protein